MLIPVRCPTCQASVGHIAPQLREEKRKRILDECKKQSLKYDGALTSVDIRLDDLFDNLAIDHLCCRSHLTTILEFRDFK